MISSTNRLSSAMDGNTPSNIASLERRIRCYHIRVKSNIRRPSAKKTDLAPTLVDIGLPSSLQQASGSRQAPLMLVFQTPVVEEHYSTSDRIGLNMLVHIVVMAVNHLQAGADRLVLQRRPLGDGEIRIPNHREDGHTSVQAPHRQARASKLPGERVFPFKTENLRAVPPNGLILSLATVVLVTFRDRTLLGQMDWGYTADHGGSLGNPDPSIMFSSSIAAPTL